MDLNLVKSYFIDNLKKGYTIELISSNLKNSGYTDDIIKQAVALLDQNSKNMSVENSKKFDYSKLPKSVQNRITPGQQPVGQQQNGRQQPGLSGNQPNPVQNPQPPPLEKHPGLDKESMIKYGGIIGGILVVIIIGVLIFALNPSDKFSSGGSMDRYAETIGLNDDNIDSSDSSSEIIDDGLDEDEIMDETLDEVSNNETIAKNETQINDSIDSSADLEEPAINQSSSQRTCETHSDCFDGDVRTLSQCDDGVCRMIRDDGRPCVSNDGFCPPRCYGYEFNDSDCFDNQGRVLCTTDEQCDNFDETTEDYCHMGRYCLHLEIVPPNIPPNITSTPILEAIVDERYEYQVIAEDEDGDEITYSLEGNYPKNMTINETSGLIVWYPTEDDYSSGEFSIIAHDGKDYDEQILHIMVYIDEDFDDAKAICGNDWGCYFNYVVINKEYLLCKNLARYWTGDNMIDEVYDCLHTIAAEEGFSHVCQYIFDAERRSSCP